MAAASWTAEPYDVGAALTLQRELGVGAAAAQVLARRGLTEPEEARAFLAADVRTDPRDLPGAEAACALVLRHLEAGSRILVFGDYDVDGVSSTAMMVRTLRALGAEPAWQLPDRAEGYGLNVAAVERIAAFGTQLLITVDCGIASAEEVAHARELGVEVLVTDHHRPPAVLPDCPIVHPALGPRGIAGPAGELCAAGVVLKLSEALYAAAGHEPARAEEDIDLAGLATVCDMVPLRDENRRIAREGVAALARARKPGVRALMDVAELQPADVDARAVGFRLGPRINAAGRMQRADAALELLLTEDPERASEIARELDGLNRDRRDTEQRILWEAEAQCAPQMAAGALVVAGEEWHPGVVGIVASRLVERFRRPAVVIALDGEGGGRGSARSIAPYDLHAGLGASAHLLRRFGGHRMAAGLEVDADNVGALRRELALHAGAALAPEDLHRTERVDAVVSGRALTLATADELAVLGPFGQGNPAPRLLVPAARVEHVTAMGEERKHARFSLVNGGARARGVAFRRSQRSLAACGGVPHDAVVSLERNTWNGAEEARVVLEAVSPSRAGALREIGPPGDFWTRLRAATGEPIGPPPPEAAQRRTIVDRIEGGVAGVAGDLLASGAPVLVVVADIARRRAGLESTVAGIGGEPAVAEWGALERDPALAEPFPVVVALDPPPTREALGAVGGTGQLHLAWGAPEREFSLAYWRHELDLRPALTALWRLLVAERWLDGDRLREALGARSPRSGAAMLGALTELGLARFDPAARVLEAKDAAPTALDRSLTAQACAERLEAVERWLGTAEVRSRAA